MRFLKTKEFTYVNDCFQNKHNEKIGHYGQTLIKMQVETSQKNMSTEIKYNKITVNSDLSFPFKIPEKYKRIE
jgi:tellurite resistance-related uncharacterized protein